QAVLMSTGLEKKFDWKTQVGAAFNATVGAVTDNELENELARIGIKTLAASGADAALNHHFDAGMMSANVLGSMIGSYAGSHITNDILKQQNGTFQNEQQSEDHHVAELGQTDIDVKDPRWSEELSEMGSQQRINRVNHSYHQTQHEAKATRAQRWSNYPSKEKVSNISSDDFSKLIHTKIGPHDEGLEPVYPELLLVGATDGYKAGKALYSGMKAGGEYLGKRLGLFGARKVGTISERINPFELQITHGKTMSNRAFKNFVDNDIKLNGIKETIKYIEHNGQKYVVDGHHRLEAAKYLNIKDVPIEKVYLPYNGYEAVEDLHYYGFNY
ncbi:MAG: ParB N-terminal domain-containing protein, partial [Gammaproteobacteria bacterium]|nr:ParB N-terminal domain-containing protein [Gammaproteobacteria bacterium]